MIIDYIYFSLSNKQKLQASCKCFGNLHPVADKFLWLISTSRSVIIIVACTVIFAMIGKDDQVALVGMNYEISFKHQFITSSVIHDITLITGFRFLVLFFISTGDVVPGLPPFKLPPFSFTGNTTEGVPVAFSLLTLLKQDISAVIVLPLLALMEHVTIAKAYAGTNRVDASQEMISIGLSNIGGAFFSSMPITGSFSRTVVNKSSGVESPMGGLVTGVLVIIALQFLTPTFYFIPKAALAR